MNSHLLRLLAFVALPVLGFVARADNPASADTSATEITPGKPFIYKQTEGRPQTLEVYYPSGWTPKNKVPAVLFFHGGGWLNGDLRQFRYQCQYFASRGLVAATANYYMVPRAEKDALQPKGAYIRPCITDAKSAIRWMKQHAVELGIDPNRLIVGGGSAGAHLAVLATVNPGLNDPQDPKDITTSVAAYLLFNPAFLRTDDESNAFTEVKAPIAPAIFFHGTRDPLLPDTIALIKQLHGLGDNATELWTAQDKAHGFFNAQPWTDLTLIQADQFLVKNHLLTGSSTLKLPATGEKLDPEP